MGHNRLPLPLPPQPDEVFTSWLVRLAAAHGLATGIFCNLIAGTKTEFNRDMDGPTCERLLPLLAARTAFRTDKLRKEHTFGGFEGRLFERVRTKAANPWVLPMGPVTNRKPALQFCPVCLALDRTPYFRRAWRLSLFVVCPTHAVLLRHLCPECGAVVSTVKGHLRHKQGTTPLCWRCGLDLRGIVGEVADARDVAFALDCQSALYEGLPPDCGSRQVEAESYFRALAILCTRLACDRPRLRSWRQMVADAAQVELPVPMSNSGITAFDTLADPASRLSIFRAVGWLLANWPTRFLDVARTANTRTSDFLPNAMVAPAWLLEPLRLYLSPIINGQPPTAGAMRAKRANNLILSMRHNWRTRDHGLIARALRAGGFYALSTTNQDILRHVRQVIARHRIGDQDHRRLTLQVARGTSEWRQLRRQARSYRKQRRNTLEETRRIILLLCHDCYLSACDLSELLGRDQHKLTVNHLMVMVREGWLRAKFGQEGGGLRNHPQQAYRSASNVQEGVD